MEQEDREHVLSYLRDNLASIELNSLQSDEISDDRKLQQLTELLDTNPGLFLSKWGHNLSQPILQLFKRFEENFGVDLPLKNLLQNGDEQYPRTPALHAVTRNRRFEFLKRNLRDTPYYSNEAIQLREPVLYEQYIGQYISEHERNAPFASNISLSDRILSDIDRQFVQEQVAKHCATETEQSEEEGEDSGDDLVPNSKSSQADETDLLNEEREEQRKTLLRILEEKFLAGKEPDFDYGKVDYNESYDDLKQQEEDIHDRYFNEEDEGIAISKPSIYTGILDY